MRTHAFLDVPDTSPTFYALCAVLLLELLAMGPLRNYVDRPETLPPTEVMCRHTNLWAFGSKERYDAMLTNDWNGVIYSIGYYAGETVTNASEVYWYGPTNRP